MTPPKYILLAEDDRALSHIVSKRLQSIGQRVYVSRDAAHTLFLMHKEPPDLVILDVLMPAGNGLAVCEMMRDDVRLRNIPVIIITGLNDDATRDRAQHLNAKFISKSDLLWEQLRSLCAELLGIDLENAECNSASRRIDRMRKGSG